ncbi:MAG: hypothetical protein, partial [Olavius algarvensis Gamma 1 endosymbiont]
YGPFATSASRSRLRLPRTTRLALRASLAGSEGWVSFKIVQNKKQLLCVTRKNALLSAGRNTF